MRHIDLCAAHDMATAALVRRDYSAAEFASKIAADSIDPMGRFIAGEIEILITKARDADKRPTTADLKRIAA